ncbi:MAG: ATP-binding protein [Bacilli bacterium]|nr:ATP-binding protein [Bacilli bacterium]
MIARESIPFAPNLIESMRSLGYSFETAIADLIDNSISANASKIDILLSPIDNPYLIILDNGYGMNSKELEEALRYGAKNPLERRENNDLGRFGLGMKSASLSQCRKLVVASKKDGAISCFSWDLDYIIQNKEWMLLEYGSEEIEKLPQIELLKALPSGTYLMLENFDRISSSTYDLNTTLNSYMNSTIDHLALVFHRFLNDGVDIYVNNNKIIPRDPFLTTNRGTQPLPEQFITINDNKIRIKPYILPYINKLTAEDLQKVGGKEDLRTNQGFYIYRNKRLIFWGSWFRLTRKEELSKLARVMVDIPNDLDEVWGVDIKKSTVHLPDVIKKNLYSCIEESVFKSKAVHEYRGRKEKNNKDINYIWERVELRDNCYEYKINRDLPQIQLFEESLDSNQLKYFDKIITNLEKMFPSTSLYIDASKGKIIDESSTVTEEEIEEMYNEICDSLNYSEKMGLNKNSVLESLLKSEPYCNYNELIEKFEIGGSNE